MIARAFSDIWSLVMFLIKVLKLHSPAARAILRTLKNFTRAHISRNVLAFIRFSILIIPKLVKEITLMDLKM